MTKLYNTHANNKIYNMGTSAFACMLSSELQQAAIGLEGAP